MGTTYAKCEQKKENFAIRPAKAGSRTQLLRQSAFCGGI